MKRAILLVLALAGALAACGAREKVADAATLDTNKAAAKAFLAKTAKEPGVKTTASGLQYKIVRTGPATGMRPQDGDLIKVHYEGKLPDGTVFDSSYARGAPAAMPLDGLIPGWIEALKLMRPGDEWIIYLPPELGYGAEGGGDKIPPNSALIFRIELFGVLSKPSFG
jgi:FKBP-type peptidyl-prolyl cis-trans isomerase FklB